MGNRQTSLLFIFAAAKAGFCEEKTYKNLVLSTELIMQIDHRTEILKADVSSVSPSSERIEELWVTCSFYSRVGATLWEARWPHG